MVPEEIKPPPQSLTYRFYIYVIRFYKLQWVCGSSLGRILIEWPIKLFSQLLYIFNDFEFPKRAVGGWWWIWRYRFEILMGLYEYGSMLWMRKVIRPGMTVADVGAHVGYFTRHLSRFVGHNGKVLAFEPSPENFPVLCRNLPSHVYPSVECLQFAVADRKGTASLYVSPGHSNHSLVEGYTEHQAEVVVDITSIDDSLAAAGERCLDFIKIDAEGAEPRILNGMKRTIAENPEIVIMIEVNPTALTSFGSSVEALIEQLDTLGFVSRLILPDGHLVDPLGTNIEGGPNLLCMRKHGWKELTLGEKVGSRSTT